MKTPRLREWRARRDLTQRELGDRSGTTPTTISRLETGKDEARVSTVARLAEALNVSVDDLVGPGSPSYEDEWAPSADDVAHWEEEKVHRLAMALDPVFEDVTTALISLFLGDEEGSRYFLKKCDSSTLASANQAAVWLSHLANWEVGERKLDRVEAGPPGSKRREDRLH